MHVSRAVLCHASCYQDPGDKSFHMQTLQRRELKLVGCAFFGGLLLFLWLSSGSRSAGEAGLIKQGETTQRLHTEITTLREQSRLQDQKLAAVSQNLRSLRHILGSLVCKDRDYVSPTGGWCLQPAEPSRGVLPNGVRIPMHHVVADPGLIDSFADLFEGQSVLDLGAGSNV